MPRTLGRNLNLCLTKFKRPISSQSSHHQEDHTSSCFIKNFNSLYDLTFDCTTTSSKFLTRSSSSDHLSSSESDPETTTTTTPDFATVFASQRFFFSSPGRSNSIIESSSSISSTSILSSLLDNPSESEPLLGGSIAVPTYSPDPYMDFRRSMQDMIDVRKVTDVGSNWDYLHELLMCYLSLNPKSTHKFIVGAFADLLVSLMTLPEEGVIRKEEISGGGNKIKQRYM